MVKRHKRLQHLLSLCGPACATYIRQMTPLRRLQSRMAGLIEPSSVRRSLGYSDRYPIGRETVSLQQLPSASIGTQILPHAITSSSQSHKDNHTPSDQDIRSSVLLGDFRNMETSLPTLTSESIGARKSIYSTITGEEGITGNQPARKRRCGTSRLSDHGVVGAIDDAAPLLSKGVHERITNPSSTEPVNLNEGGPGAETHTGSVMGDEITNTLDNLYTSLDLATGPDSPFSQVAATTAYEYTHPQADPQARIDQGHSLDISGHSPSLNLYDRWPFDSIPRNPSLPPQQSTDHADHATSWNPTTVSLYQQVIGSVGDGTVDPRALNLRA